MNTIINLIDFVGHPVQGDEFINNLRYSKLIEIIEDSNIKKTNNYYIITSENADERTRELLSLARKKQFNIIYHSKMITIEKLHKTIYKLHNTRIHTENTKFIFGGTNTSGCLLNSYNISVIPLATLGYRCKIYLPMCADYFIPGINEIERNSNSFVKLYKTIKEYNVTECVEIVSKYQELF